MNAPATIDRAARVLVTGAGGLVGGATVRALTAAGYADVRTPPRTELDCERRDQTLEWFARERPAYVIHLAARVGGIAANIADPTGFLARNVTMGINVLDAAHFAGVRKVVLPGSSCMYPRACPQPMNESMLMTGPLEPTNAGYALAKITTLTLGRAYHDQFGLAVVNPLPSNVYGPHDHFDLERGHVLAALAKRFVDAQRAGASDVTLWGTGAARREFVHAEDLARALVFFLEHVRTPEPINVGPGSDVSVRDLARMIADKVGFTGRILWDSSKPDGMPRKCMDVARLRQLGFTTRVPLDEGLDGVIAAYRGRA